MKRLKAGQTMPEVASALGITAKTVRKWRSRYEDEGLDGLRDRSSRPFSFS